MSQLERIVKMLFNALGIEILRTEKGHSIRTLQPTPTFVTSAVHNFTDNFPISPDYPKSRREIEQEMCEYEWFYPFTFDGIRAPGDQTNISNTRNRHYYRYLHVFSAILSQTEGTLAGNSVLDIACNAGFWAIQACRSGADNVVGIDASPRNIDQANFIAGIIGLEKLSYQISNIYDITKEQPDMFDITLFLGVLYHLDKPIMALEQLYAVTRKFAVIDTALVNVKLPMFHIREDDARFYHHQSHSNTLALFPSISAMALILKSVGFRDVWYVQNISQSLPQPYLTGKWGTFIAFK
jgi:SAM-dependent methyltransferase